MSPLRTQPPVAGAAEARESRFPADAASDFNIGLGQCALASSHVARAHVLHP